MGCSDQRLFARLAIKPATLTTQNLAALLAITSLSAKSLNLTMKGADAEAGAHFGARDFNFFAGAGPYYFDGQ